MVTSFKFLLANHMLLRVMEGAKTDHPAVRRLQTNSAVRITTNMSTLNWKSGAAWHRTMMSAHPCTVRRTFSAVSWTA